MSDVGRFRRKGFIGNHDELMGEPGWFWRFCAQIGTGGEDDCWPWIGHGLAAGYGTIAIDGKAWLATHLSLTVSGEPRPEGGLALHTCDNPRCVNPKHLWWGSQADNMRDMADKGRGNAPRGSRNWLAKLTDDDVREIRASVRPASALASKYGVDRSKICRIRNRKAWAHVED